MSVSVTVVCVHSSCPFPFSARVHVMGCVRVSAIVSVFASVFFLAHVSDCVDQCPCSRCHVSVRDRVRVHIRDRVRVRDRIGFRCRSISIHVPCPCLCP